MTQFPNTKSTSQRQSWQGSGRPFDNLLAVCLWMLMTPSILSLAVTWLLVTMLLKGLVSVSTRAESVVSTAKSEAEKFNTQVWSPSSKNLSQLSDAARKTASEVGQRLSTFRFGTKKSKTSSSSKTTKGQKTTESVS